MRASAVIVERLKALGYEVLEPPERNMYYLCCGWRTAGTCCWSVRVAEKKGDVVVWVGEILSQHSMATAAKAPDWTLTPDMKHGVHGAQRWLDPTASRGS